MDYVKNSIPKGIKPDIRLDTMFDIIWEIIQIENGKSQGRRYGHLVIDIAREINRYLHPDIRCASRDKAEIDNIKKKFKEKIIKLMS